ncbi:MAG: glycine betaine ABC transporter substrate-binding protein [Desulfobacter sp.]
MGNTQTPSAYRILIIAFILFLGAAVFYVAAVNTDRAEIRLHDDQIDIQKLTNAIARFILEKGYGYEVTMVESTIKEVHERLTAGDIDVTLEMWKDNNLAWYDMAKKKGDVVDLGPIYTGGRQYWIIPRWYAREKNITSVFQMKQHWRDFANPEDPSKGIFFNCIFGWSCRDINRVKLEAYGLDRYFNTVSPTSPEALESIYENARMRELPVFGYYWEPNALTASQDWYALEEPAHDPGVWEEIIQAATDPDAPRPKTACAFKEISVHKLSHRKLLETAPDAARMLENMIIPVHVFDDILFSNARRSVAPEAFKHMARRFFNAYPETWQTWVTEDAAQKIRTALASAAIQALKEQENDR